MKTGDKVIGITCAVIMICLLAWDITHQTKVVECQKTPVFRKLDLHNMDKHGIKLWSRYLAARGRG